MRRRRWAVGLLAAAACAAATLGILYSFFGLRYAPTGSGLPRFAFVTPLDEQARVVAEHRAAQRNAPVAVTAPPAAAGPDDAEAPASAGIGTDADAAAAAREAPPTPDGAPTDDGAASAGALASDAAPPDTDPSASAYWTSVRGPARDGVYRERPILATWPASGLTPMWTQPVGGGYASFAAARGRAFTIEQRGRDEVVAAYDIETGRELWTHSWPELFQEAMGGDGPRATPTWADGIVYTLGAAGELRALDEATGRQIWRTNILQENGARNLDWGMGAWPLVVDDTVIVLPGGPRGRSIVAYHRRTGERVWSSGNDRQAYSSPMLARLAGRDQLLVLSAERLMGLTPDAGELLWSYPWVTQAGINVAQPIVIGETRVFISSGYGVGAAVLEIVPEGEAFAVREVWRNTRMKNKFTSSVLHDGFIYGLDESILACVDAETGALRWKGGRYGYGQILLAGDRIIVLTEDGDLALVDASPERHRELARSPALSGKTWNHLAIENGRLLVRNLGEMAAFDLRAP